MTLPESAAGAGSSAVIDGVDVDAVAAAVRACPGVDDLFSSPTAVISSYLPHRQVGGVRVRPDAVAIQIRSRWGVSVPAVGAQVQAAVLGLVGGRDVDVLVAEVADPAPPGESGIVWTNTSDAFAATSSGPIIPTTVETPPSS